MKNYKQPGDSMNYTNATGVTIESGQAVEVGDHVFIAAGKILNGEIGVLKTSGVFELPKVAPLVIGQGAHLYYDVSANKVTTDDDSGTNKAIGYAFASAVSAATVIDVNVCPVVAGPQGEPG